MILAVTGLKREARLVSGEAVRPVVSGGDGTALDARLAQAWAEHGQVIQGVISIGLAGALAPGLAPGDVVVGSTVIDGEASFATHAAWSEIIAMTLPQAGIGPVAGSDAILATPEAKAALHAATQATAVDMESHRAARFAAGRKLPLAVLRIISDGADQALPKAAQAGMRPDGGIDLAAVLLSLLRDPSQLPALIRTGREAEKAFSALLRCNRLLGPGLGFGQLRQHPLDVA